MYFLNFPASFSLVSPHLSCCLWINTFNGGKRAPVLGSPPHFPVFLGTTSLDSLLPCSVSDDFNVFLLYIDCVFAIFWLLPVVFIGTICLRWPLLGEADVLPPLALGVQPKEKVWSPVRGGQQDRRTSSSALRVTFSSPSFHSWLCGVRWRSRAPFPRSLPFFYLFVLCFTDVIIEVQGLCILFLFSAFILSPKIALQRQIKENPTCSAVCFYLLSPNPQFPLIYNH